MKKIFFGFYEPTDAEIEKSWKDGIFVFDANALLNLYRYTESTRKDFLSAITKLKDKLFMPYQVGYEYHNNRHLVIESLNNSYNNLSSTFKDTCDKPIANLLNQYTRHPSIQIENLKKIQDDFFKKIDAELDKQKKAHPDFITKDEVLTQLTELYDNKVGTPFNKDILKKIYIEGKERYEQQIPPGYKDQETKRKKGEQHVYGDLIIWKEIIAFANKEKKPIIFVTDDRKEDWWTIDNGKTLRPREELIKEFYDLTGIRILIYNADTFLHFAKERKIVTKIKEASITEMKEVRKADESLNTLSDILRSDAYKSTSQFYNPIYDDLLKTTGGINTAAHLFNSGNSIYGDLFKTTAGINTAAHLFNQGNSIYGDLFKTAAGINTAAHLFNPVNSPYGDLFRTTDALNTAAHLYKPANLATGDSVKITDTQKEQTQAKQSSSEKINDNTPEKKEESSTQ